MTVLTPEAAGDTMSKKRTFFFFFLLYTFLLITMHFSNNKFQSLHIILPFVKTNNIIMSSKFPRGRGTVMVFLYTLPPAPVKEKEKKRGKGKGERNEV